MTRHAAPLTLDFFLHAPLLSGTHSEPPTKHLRMPENDGLMADPYASPSAPTASSTLPSLPSFSGGGGGGGGGEGYGSGSLYMPDKPAPIPTPNFLFEESYDEAYRRSWGERMTYHVGLGYLVGITGGGAAGIAQGLRESTGERQRIRINRILNATAKRGPGLGNSIGCIAMMCSIFESLAYNIRGEDDLLDPVGGAALTGMLYKITAGPRVAGTWAAGLAAFAGAASFAAKQASQRGLLKNFL